MYKSKKLLAVICTLAMIATLFSSFVVYAADVPAASLDIKYNKSSTATKLVFDITTDATYVSAASILVDVSGIMNYVDGSTAVAKRNAIKNNSVKGSAMSSVGTFNLSVLASNKFKMSFASNDAEPADFSSDSLVAQMVIPLATELDKKVTFAFDTSDATYLSVGVEDESSDSGFSYEVQEANSKLIATATASAGSDAPADKDPVVESVTVTPATATVEGGATETFTAVVAGQTGLKGGAEVAVPQDVEWTATAGTIVDGVFTAPAATDAEQTITVTATAKGTSVSGTATVTVPAKPVVVTTTVTVTDAKATQSAVFKSQNTMYWGVKISNGLKGDVTAQLDAGEDDKSKVTTLDFSEVTINGDAEFGVYTKLAAERLDKAIKLVITDVASGVVGESTAASYNSLK